MTWAGSERVVEQMLRVFPQADLVVGVRAPAMADLNDVTRRARETWLRFLPKAREHHRWFLPLHAAAFASIDTRRYDLVISSSHAFSKAVRTRRPTRHLCYCYSPPRYVWDLGRTYQRHAGRLEGLALGVATPVLRQIDRWGAGGVGHFAAISHHVADRIRRCYGRRATVIHPPVTPKPAPRNAGAREDFLLTLGRLVPYKRVDLAVAAAERLGIRLVVAGDGPERRRLERSAGRHVEFTGEVTEAEAGRLLEACRAFVFCAEEDFGIAPLEANAHGAPVVGYARGGLLETMQPGRSAVYFERQDVAAVEAAIVEAWRTSWDEQDVRENATRFAPARFQRQFADLCADIL